MNLEGLVIEMWNILRSRKFPIRKTIPGYI